MLIRSLWLQNHIRTNVMFFSCINRLFTRFVCWIWRLFGFESRDQKFERTEKHLLKSCKRFYQENFVPIETNLRIRTVVFNPGVPNRHPLVLLHGLDSGLCSFHHNVSRLSGNCTVYAIDLPGFGRSSKLDVLGNGQDIERKYVRWLELWRQRLGIEKFFLLGHDFGGYVATLYTLSYPWRVCHLILYDPWGFPILPFGISDRSPNKKSDGNPDVFPNWISKLDNILHRLSFLYRLMWFYYLQSRSFARLVRHPLQFLQGFCKKEDPLMEYQGLCKQAQNTSGKIAYCKLSLLNTWARYPLIKRINSLDTRVFITFIFGSKSWFDHRSAYEVKCSRSNQESVSVHIVEGEGTRDIHQEEARKFESIILNKLKSYEEEHDEGWIEDDWISCCDHSDTVYHTVYDDYIDDKEQLDE